MTEKNEMTVKVMLTSEETRESDYTFDLDDFLEWTGGRSPTGSLVKEFIESGRDREQIEEGLWYFGTPVASVTRPFVEIERVIIE